MIKLNDFTMNSLLITWTAIKIGFEGIDFFPSQIDANDVIEYAAHCVEIEFDNSNEVVLLACTGKDDVEGIRRLLYQLSSCEQLDSCLEIRKWRVLALKKMMSKLSVNHIDGLCDFTDFWAMFDYPSDSPHSVQGRGNSISPQDYFTEENYQNIISNHFAWIEKEFRFLQMSPEGRNVLFSGNSET